MASILALDVLIVFRSMRCSLQVPKASLSYDTIPTIQYLPHVFCLKVKLLQIVQAIGAAEDNVLDFGAPKRIDGTAATNLISAAVQVQAEQYVMISSLGTGKWGWPAGSIYCFLSGLSILARLQNNPPSQWPVRISKPALNYNADSQLQFICDES